MPNMEPCVFIFLSGGKGVRLGSAIPKQYLTVGQRTLALYSFDAFLNFEELKQIIVVCEEEYQYIYREAAAKKGVDLLFAKPGVRRQDSLFNALQFIQGDPLVCIHDAVRPFVDIELIRKLIQEALIWDAVVPGVKVKDTIKVCDGAQVVVETPDRFHLWQIQTPQVIRFSLLQEGFIYAQKFDLTVSDDASLVELIGRPVKVIEGSYKNIKITTPEDLGFAEQLIETYALLQTYPRL